MTADSAPLFSIIVPTFNRSSFLGEAIASALTQTVEDFELLLVNDGGEIPDRLPTDPRLRLIQRQVTGGPGAARNSGLAEASGHYVTFLDDDDLLLPRRLEIAEVGLQEARIAVCQKADVRRRRRSQAESQLDYHTVHDSGPPHLGCTAIERSIAPLFNETYLACQDVEWWFRASEFGPIASSPEVGYFQRPSSVAAGRLNDQSRRLQFNRLLLVDFADYYRTHPRARAFRLKRVALRELAAGNTGAARQSLRQSFAASPSIRTAWHLARATFGSAPRR